MSDRLEPPSDIRLPLELLRAYVTDLFTACQMSESDAGLASDAILAADLRGAYSHGCAHVPWYVSLLLDRGVNPAGRPTIATDAGAALVVDGGNALGHIVVAFAMQRAIERALTTGVAAVAIRGSNHCGALGYYTTLAVARDMIGIVTTNAMPTMAPWGGLDPIIGINPVAIGLPARDEAPFVLDTSFGSAARAKIVAFAEAGQPLPQGWALDKFGQPTADARTALDGLITPIGGYKGTGLAMAVGILSTLLAGAAYGSQLGDLAHGASPGRDGQFVLVLNIAAFEDVDTFKSRVDEIIREIHGSRRTPGVDALRVPGEHAAATERSRKRQGIPLSKATFQGLVAAGHRLSVDVSQLQDATGRVNAS